VKRTTRTYTADAPLVELGRAYSTPLKARSNGYRSLSQVADGCSDVGSRKMSSSPSTIASGMPAVAVVAEELANTRC
jgi:hypothetical protein